MLYIDELNLLDANALNLVLAAVGSGTNQVEREGQRGPPLPAAADCHLQPRGRSSSRSPAGSLCDCLRLIRHRYVARQHCGPLSPTAKTRKRSGPVPRETDALATQLLLARQWLPDVQISREQIAYLVNEALRGGVEGHRAGLYALRVARAHAALQGRDQVEAEDLQLAVRLVIAPRAKLMPRRMISNNRLLPTAATGRQRRATRPPESEDNNEDEEPILPSPMSRKTTRPKRAGEFMLDAEATAIDPELLQFQSAKNRASQQWLARHCV